MNPRSEWFKRNTQSESIRRTPTSDSWGLKDWSGFIRIQSLGFTRIETDWFLTELHQTRLKTFFGLTRISSDWRGNRFRKKFDWFGMYFNPKLLPGLFHTPPFWAPALIVTIFKYYYYYYYNYYYYTTGHLFPISKPNLINILFHEGNFVKDPLFYFTSYFEWTWPKKKFSKKVKLRVRVILVMSNNILLVYKKLITIIFNIFFVFFNFDFLINFKPKPFCPWLKTFLFFRKNFMSQFYPNR